MKMQALTSMPDMFDRRWNNVQFRVLFNLSFPVFLFAIALSRLDPRRWSKRAGSRRSVLSEAWEAAGTVAQIAFAG